MEARETDHHAAGYKSRDGVEQSKVPQNGPIVFCTTDGCVDHVGSHNQFCVMSV